MPPKKSKAKENASPRRNIESSPKPPPAGEGAYYAENGSVRQIKHSELCGNTATVACAACGVTICHTCGWRCGAHFCFNHFCEEHKQWAWDSKCPHKALRAPTSKNEAPPPLENPRVWHVVSGTSHENERVVEVVATKEEARVIAQMVMNERTYDPDYDKWTETAQDHWENRDQYVYLDERALISKSAESRVYGRRRASSKNEMPVPDAAPPNTFRGLFEYESVDEKPRGDKTFRKCKLLTDIDSNKKGEEYDKIKWKKLDPGLLNAVKVYSGGGKTFQFLRDWDPLYPARYDWVVFEGEAHEGGHVEAIVDNKEEAIAVAKLYMESTSYAKWKQISETSWNHGCVYLFVDKQPVISKASESHLFKKRKVEKNDAAPVANE